MYILLSSEKTLYKVKTSSLSRPGVATVVTAELHHKIRSNLPELITNEQTEYATTAAEAAYSSLNPLDWTQGFHAEIRLIPNNDESVSFDPESNSSGLGYALALALQFRRQLNKDDNIDHEVFATGRIHASGNVSTIGHLPTKITAACNHVESLKSDGNKIKRFFIFYPKADHREVTDELDNRVQELGGKLIPVTRLSQALSILLGDSYDGVDGDWSPFKGLESFNYEDQKRFFGRERAVQQLLQNYQDSDGLLVVTGVSGSGKSSVIKAGLIPEIEKQLTEDQKLSWHVVNPKTHNSVESILTALFKSLKESWQFPEKPENLAKQALKQAESINLTHNSESTCLWFIDQYEEIFNNAQIPRDQSQQLAPVLEKLANTIDGLRIVVSIRAEYLETFGRHGIDTHVSQKLNPDEWNDVVKKQAAYSGLHYEDDLEQRIINDANDIAHALPVVEYLLEQLYQKATQENESAKLLKQSHYEELGGLKGVVANRAEAAISHAPYLAETFFDYFVGQNSEKIAYPRSVDINSIQEEQPELYQLIQLFIDEQLVIDCSSEQKTRVKLAHDSLFTEWGRLKEWLENQQEYLVWRSQIDGNFELWLQTIKQNRKNYIIKNSGLLKRARRLIKLKKIHNPELIRYINSSVRSRRVRVAIISIAFSAMATLLLNEIYNQNEQIINKDKTIQTISTSLNEHKSKALKLEMSLNRELIDEISASGLFIEDHIAINNADYIKDVLLNTKLTPKDKQSKLNELSFDPKNKGSASDLSKKLGKNGFKIDESQVKNFPRIYEMVFNSRYMNHAEQQDAFNKIPSMSKESLNSLYVLLIQERNEVDAKARKEIEKLSAISKGITKYKPKTLAGNTTGQSFELVQELFKYSPQKAIEYFEINLLETFSANEVEFKKIESVINKKLLDEENRRKAADNELFHTLITKGYKISKKDFDEHSSIYKFILNYRNFSSGQKQYWINNYSKLSFKEQGKLHSIQLNSLFEFDERKKPPKKDAKQPFYEIIGNSDDVTRQNMRQIMDLHFRYIDFKVDKYLSLGELQNAIDLLLDSLHFSDKSGVYTVDQYVYLCQKLLAIYSYINDFEGAGQLIENFSERYLKSQLFSSRDYFYYKFKSEQVWHYLHENRTIEAAREAYGTLKDSYYPDQSILLVLVTKFLNRYNAPAYTNEYLKLLELGFNKLNSLNEKAFNVRRESNVEKYLEKFNATANEILKDGDEIETKFLKDELNKLNKEMLNFEYKKDEFRGKLFEKLLSEVDDNMKFTYMVLNASFRIIGENLTNIKQGEDGYISGGDLFCLKQEIKETLENLNYLLVDSKLNKEKTKLLMIKFKSILQLELFTKAEQQLECKNDVLQESILSAYDNGYLSDEFHHFHFDVLTIDEYVGEGASIGSKLYDIDLLDDNSRGWWEGTLPSLFFGTREELNSFLDQHINKNHKLQDEYLKNVKEGVINLIESSKAGKANKGILKDDTQIKVAKLFLQTEPKTTIATLEPLLKKYLSVQSSTNIKAREFDAAYGNNLRAAYKIMAQANINLGNLDNAEKNYIKFLDTRGISGEVTKENLEVDRALIDIYKRSNNHLKIIKIRQKIKSHYVHEAKKGTQNNSAYEEITENLGSLSWNYLLTKQYDKAYESAAEALKTDPSKIWVKTNLAHALLLSGKKERAETIYLVNANQILNQDRSFGTAVIDDFKRLKEHGISHPYMKSIEEKINNLITP